MIVRSRMAMCICEGWTLIPVVSLLLLRDILLDGRWMRTPVALHIPENCCQDEGGDCRSTDGNASDVTRTESLVIIFC